MGKEGKFYPSMFHSKASLETFFENDNFFMAKLNQALKKVIKLFGANKAILRKKVP